MLKRSITIAIVTIVLSISAINSMAQRVTPGEMGCLLGVGHGCGTGGNTGGNGGNSGNGGNGGGTTGGTTSGGGIGSGATGAADMVLQSNGQLDAAALALGGSHFE